MTYYDIVNRVQEVVSDHAILQDFGYGALSDIKTVDEGTRVNYPYAFLNPTQSTRDGQTITFRFNLIVMDVAQEDPDQKWQGYLKVQSECQQYVDDILARLRFYYTDQVDLTLNVALTPFKERFQDTVAGMTATLEFQIPVAINDCVTPYITPVYNTKAFIGLRDYNGSGGSNAFARYEIPEALATYRVQYTLRIKTLEAMAAEDGGAPYIESIQDGDTPRIIDRSTFDGSADMIGIPQDIEVSYDVELEDVAPDNNDISIRYGNSAFSTQTNAIEVLSGALNIYTL